MANEQYDERLAALLKAGQPNMKPATERRALAAMADASQDIGTKRKSAWRWRLIPAGVLAVVLVSALIWWPQRHGMNVALADVANALQQVHSVHYVGWDPNQGQRKGGRDHIEGWFEGRRGRTIEGDVLDDIIDENGVMEIRREYGAVAVTIDALPAEVAQAFAEGKGIIAALPLLWPQAAEDALNQRGEVVTHEERQSLPNGQTVTVFDLTNGRQLTRMTVDEETKLVLHIEHYESGMLVGAIEEIEYNVDIPDEVFKVSIPKGASVVDRRLTSPSVGSPPVRRSRMRSMVTREIPVLNSGGMGGYYGCPFHTKIHFEVRSGDDATVVYLPKKNAYRVKGRVRVVGLGMDRVVENSDFVASTPPDVTPEQWQEQQAQQHWEMARRMPSPEVQAQRRAKGKELRAAGAKSLGTCGGMFSTSGIAFEVLNNQMIEIWYLPRRGEFYVMGKALVRRDDFNFSRIVENGWIKVPGPAPKLP